MTRRRQEWSWLVARIRLSLDLRRLNAIERFYRALPVVEHIGAPDCPLMDRWTIWESDRLDCKLLLHHFLPYASDPDCHDHPRPFITAVLRGRYEDIVPCYCNRVGEALLCVRCHGTGKVLGEAMRAGTIRRRSARHTHLTRTRSDGAWTVVLMGPKRRPWGFWRNRHWWPFKAYEERFGFHMRCESESGGLLRGREASMDDISRASEALGDRRGE